MRKLILIVLILTAQNLLAQQEPPPNNQEEPRPAQQAQQPPQAQEAPKLGHPLDPADVDILTGKTKASGASGYGTYAAAPYAPVSYPVNVAEYSASRSLGWNSLASPPFAFGRFNGSNFVIGGTAGFGPPFLFGRGRFGVNNFFFAPARPGFFFFRR